MKLTSLCIVWTSCLVCLLEAVHSAGRQSAQPEAASSHTRSHGAANTAAVQVSSWKQQQQHKQQQQQMQQRGRRQLSRDSIGKLELGGHNWKESPDDSSIGSERQTLFRPRLSGEATLATSPLLKYDKQLQDEVRYNRRPSQENYPASYTDRARLSYLSFNTQHNTSTGAARLVPLGNQVREADELGSHHLDKRQTVGSMSQQSEPADLGLDDSLYPIYVARRYQVYRPQNNHFTSPYLSAQEFKETFRRSDPYFMGKRKSGLDTYQLSWGQGDVSQLEPETKRAAPKFVGRRDPPYFVGKRPFLESTGQFIRENSQEWSEDDKRAAPKFVGKRRSPYFVGKRGNSNSIESDGPGADGAFLNLDDKRAAPRFVGRRESPYFVGKRESEHATWRDLFTEDDFIGPPTIGGKRRAPYFVGKRGSPKFVGKRVHLLNLDGVGSLLEDGRWDSQTWKDRRGSPYFVGKRDNSNWNDLASDSLEDSDTGFGKRRAPYFVGKRGAPKFVGKRSSPLDLDEINFPFSTTQWEGENLLDRRGSPYFVGKRKAPKFVGKRWLAFNSQDKIPSLEENHQFPQLGDRTGSTLSSDTFGITYSDKDVSDTVRPQPPLPRVLVRRGAPFFVGKRKWPLNQEGHLSEEDTIRDDGDTMLFSDKRRAPKFVGKRGPPFFVGKRKLPSVYDSQEQSPGTSYFAAIPNDIISNLEKGNKQRLTLTSSNAGSQSKLDPLQPTRGTERHSQDNSPVVAPAPSYTQVQSFSDSNPDHAQRALTHTRQATDSDVVR